MRGRTWGSGAAIIVCLALTFTLGAAPAQARTKPQPARSWTSTADGAQVLAASPRLRFTARRPASSRWQVIGVNANRRAQQFAGTGASMTESSAAVINQLPWTQRARLMRDLFGPTGLKLAFLRQPLGSSDFVTSPRFTSYLELPGLYDYSRDLTGILPLIKAAQGLNPWLKFTGAPWSAPGWMKSSGSLRGGTLRADAVTSYARYLADVALAYAGAGVPLADLSIQNEPGHESSYPTMRLSVEQQIAVLRETDRQLSLRGLSTKLWAFDHNWDGVDQALQVLAGVRDLPRVVGAAFHCYAGQAEETAAIRTAGWRVRQTECSGTKSADPSRTYADTLVWQSRNLVVEGIRGGSETVTLWNLALNAGGGPHFGSCADRCTGVVTVANGSYTRNAEWTVLAHVGKFVTPGARVLTTPRGRDGLSNVAFRNPDGSRVMVLVNESSRANFALIKERKRYARVKIPASSVVTVRWR